MERMSITTLIPSIAIFISGFTPLFFIMVIKDIKEFVWFVHDLEKPVLVITTIKIPYFISVGNIGVVISLVVISVLSWIMLQYVLKNISNNPFEITITRAKSRSSEVVNYTIPYMISFVAFDLSKWQDLVSLLLFLSILCLLSIRSQSIFINPILAAKGYGLYDCTFDENGISKECVMLSKSDLKADNIEHYKKLNNYMGFIAN